MAIELASAYVSILPSAKGFSSALDKELSGVGRHAGGKFASDYGDTIAHEASSGGKIGRGFLMIGKAASMAGLAVGAAGVAAGGFGLKLAADNEMAEKSFTRLLGSTEKAQVVLGDLKKFAARTPFEFPELRTAAAGFLAVGVQSERIIPLLTTIGDATSAMGTGAGGIDRATYALKQMQMAGRVTKEDMNQLVEAGVPAWDGLAEVLGTDVAGAMKKVSDGTVKADDVFKALETRAGPTMQRIAGGMDDASQTFSGMWSSLKDTVGQGLADAMMPILRILTKAMPTAIKIAEAATQRFSIIIEAVTEGVGGFIAAFREGDVTSDGFVGFMERVGVAAREVYDVVIPAIADAFSWFADNVVPKVGQALAWVADEVFPKIVTGVKEVTKWIGANWRNIFEKAGEIIADVGKILFEFGKWIVENRPVLIGLAVTVGVGLVTAFIMYTAAAASAAIATIAAVAPFVAIGVAITAVVAALVYAYQEWEWFRKAVDATVDWITGTLVPVLKTIGEAIVTGIAAAVEWVTETAIPALVDAFHFVEGVVKAVWPTIETIIKVALEVVRTYIETWIAVVKKVWSSLDEIYWFLKNFVIDPILKYVEIWWAIFSTAVETGIAAVITAFKVILEIVDWLNTWVIEPIKKAVDLFFNAAGGVVKLFEDGIGFAIDAFHVLEDVVNWLQVHVIDPVLKKVDEFTGAIGRGFEAAKEAAWTAWQKIQEVVKVPINVVIGFINGLTGGVNYILRFLQMPEIPGIEKLAKGGWVPGTGNQDTVPALLTPGEYVIPKKAAAAWDDGTLELVRRGPQGTVDPGIFGYAAGGYVRGPDEALAWSRQHDNKRYQFPMVGPSTFDCSGFMGAIWNFIMGRNPYRRVFSTGSFGGSGYRNYGFEKGYDPSGFSVGVRLPYTRNAQGATVGHMAGTLAGTAVEAGGNGVQVGPPARSATSGFPLMFTLPGYGQGTFAGGGGLPREGVFLAVEGAIKGGGFTGSDLIRMVAIAGGESGYNPNVHTVDSDDDSWGLWQINKRAWDIKGLGFQRWEDLFDPINNGRAARHIWDQQGYRAWGAFTNGSYQNYMAEAVGAVSAYQAAGGFGPSEEEKSLIAKMKDIAGAVLGDIGESPFANMLEKLVTDIPKQVFNKLMVELPGRFINWVKDAVGAVAGLVFPGPSESSWAEGGIIKARTGGTRVNGLFAENGHDEAIVPLPNGWQNMGGVTVVLKVEGNIYGDRAFDEKLDKSLHEYGRQVRALAGRS